MSYVPFLASSMLVALSSALAAQGAVGVLADRGSPTRQPYAHVFDPGTMKITASVPLPLANFAAVFDVEIAPDRSEAYLSDFAGARVWVVDLTTNPPSLAGGTNPISVVDATSGVNGAVSASASDLAVTDDGRFLLVSGGNALGDGGSAFGVVDLRTRTVVDKVDLSPNSPTAVDVGPDGAVVVVELLESLPSSAKTNLRGYQLSPEGKLVSTGVVLDHTGIPGVQNVLIPSYTQLPPLLRKLTARHTFHIARPAGGAFGSLRTKSLGAADTSLLAFPSGIDMVFDPLCSVLFARTNESASAGGAGVGNARIDGYPVSPLTGRIGPRVLSIGLDRRAGTAFGVEQTAIGCSGACSSVGWRATKCACSTAGPANSSPRCRIRTSCSAWVSRYGADPVAAP